jgi:signal transduction histidine kinase
MTSNNHEKRLIRQLEIERLISKIARNFVHLNQIDSSTKEALKAIGEFSHASRAYIFEFQDNNVYMDNTFEWCAIGVSEEIDNLKDQEISLFPWWFKRLSTGNVLNIYDVSALEEEAIHEKEILQMQGIKSVLVLPIMIKGELRGFVGFDNVDSVGVWNKDDEVILGLAAEFFSNAFERMIYEREIVKKNQELKEALDALKLAQTLMIHQEQMAAVGQLAAGVAHEINNPLGFVLSNHRTLKNYFTIIIDLIDKCDLNTFEQKTVEEYRFIKEDIFDLLNDVEIGLNRVGKIVEGLRSFSRVDNMDDFGPYDLNEGIKTTLAIINNKINHNTTLKLSLGDIPTIMANGSKMNQVILNLISNAIEAIEESSRFDKGNISISSYENLNSIFLKIIDNGIGMNEETKNRIFTPFFTTKPVGKGTGIGMSIVFEIVTKLHKGEIIIDSNYDSGTEIIIKLPMK